MSILLKVGLILVLIIIIIYLSHKVGGYEGYPGAYKEGYDKGFTDAENSLIAKDFPKSEGGNFYSTNKAMQDISNKKKDGD